MASSRADLHAPVAKTATLLVGAFFALLGLAQTLGAITNITDPPRNAEAAPYILDLLQGVVTLAFGGLVAFCARSFSAGARRDFMPAVIGWAAFVLATGILLFVRPMVADGSATGKAIVSGLMMAGAGGVALAAAASWANAGMRRNAGILAVTSAGLYFLAALIFGQQETAGATGAQSGLLLSLAVVCVGIAVYIWTTSGLRNPRTAASFTLMAAGLLGGVALIVVGATAFDNVNAVGEAFDETILAGFQSLALFFGLLSALVGGLATVGASGAAAFARLPADTKGPAAAQ